MLNPARMKLLIALLLMTGALAWSPLLVLGQDETATEEPSAAQTVRAETADDSAPAGTGQLILLAGLASVVLVGGTMVARENFRQQEE